MRPDYFYFSTTKNIVASFGIIFSDVVFENDFGESVKVPIHFTSKEKFTEVINANTDYESALQTESTLPRFGFELTSIDFDSSRMTNPLSRMRDSEDQTKQYMLSRIPYNFSFSLYLVTRKLEDSLKIMEQIVPFFTPDLNITIKDKSDFGYMTDIPFSLSNMSLSIDNQGSFETRRTILWQFNFIAKAWLYSNVRKQNRIKETIVKMEDEDFSVVYEALTSEIVPRQAEKDEPHQIIDKVTDNQHISFTFDFVDNLALQISGDSDTEFTIFDFGEFVSGHSFNVIEFK